MWIKRFFDNTSEVIEKDSLILTRRKFFFLSAAAAGAAIVVPAFIEPAGTDFFTPESLAQLLGYRYSLGEFDNVGTQNYFMEIVHPITVNDSWPT